MPEGSEHAIGLFQLRSLEPGFWSAEWGFILGASFWGSGLFETGARLVLDFAFDTLGVHRMEARAVVQNGRGNGALRKLGSARRKKGSSGGHFSATAPILTSCSGRSSAKTGGDRPSQAAARSFTSSPW